jgi:hypothetical protein
MELEEALDRRQRLRRLGGLPQQVRALELRLLRQHGAGGAAFETLVELDRLLVGAGRLLLLGFGVEPFGGPLGRVLLADRVAASQPEGGQRDRRHCQPGTKGHSGHRGKGVG